VLTWILTGGMIILVAGVESIGEAPAADRSVITLWPGGAPGAKGNEADRDVPTLTAWLPKPELATGSAVVICPGGGYGMLAGGHEGRQVAEWLNSLGVAAFVLKYRLGPRYHHPAMLQDAGRAIRTVRARASSWGVDPNRIAILGFSAGGHLAALVGTDPDGPAGPPSKGRFAGISARVEGSFTA